MMRFKCLPQSSQLFLLIIAMIALFSTLSTSTARAADDAFPVAYSELHKGYSFSISGKMHVERVSEALSDLKDSNGKLIPRDDAYLYLEPGSRILIIKRKLSKFGNISSYFVKSDGKYYRVSPGDLRGQTDHVSIPDSQLAEFLGRRKKASERLWKEVDGKPGKEITIVKGAKLTSRPGKYYKQIFLITDKQTPAKLVDEVPGYYLVRLWDGKTNQAGWVAQAHLGKAELDRIKKERQAKARHLEPLPPNVEPLPHDKLFPGCSLVLRKDLYALTVLDDSFYLPPGTRIKITKRAGSESYPEYQFNIEYGGQWLGKFIYAKKMAGKC
jgi:hypothetical protein